MITKYKYEYLRKKADRRKILNDYEIKEEILPLSKMPRNIAEEYLTRKNRELSKPFICRFGLHSWIIPSVLVSDNQKICKHCHLVRERWIP